MKFMVSWASETTATTDVIEAEHYCEAFRIAHELMGTGYGHIIRNRVMEDDREDDIVVLEVEEIDESYVPTLSKDDIERYLSDPSYVSPEERFEKMVAKYETMGVRMVCFDTNQEMYEESIGSWIMPFYTHGVSAEDIAIERFDGPAMRQWMKWCGYKSYDEMEHYDVTNDMGLMIGCYDYEARYVVQQLA